MILVVNILYYDYEDGCFLIIFEYGILVWYILIDNCVCQYSLYFWFMRYWILIIWISVILIVQSEVIFNIVWVIFGMNILINGI